MRNSLSLPISILCLAALCSCVGGKQTAMYALIPSSKVAARFNQDLALLAKRHGLKPRLGRATDDQGHTLYVLEANGRSMRLWSQNVDLSGHEDPTQCGSYIEVHPDPGQYIVYIEPTLPFMNNADALDVASQIRQELSSLGYEMRSEQVLCSSLSKSAARTS